jgi:RNA polymerase sigma-70 factor (ECF subfamily)
MSLSNASMTEDLANVEPNELVRLALGGCSDAFTELSCRFRPRLLQLLRPRLGGHWADAEDVAQDALTRAFQSLERFDPRYQFSTWLYTIAVRLAYDHSRVRRRDGNHLSLDAEPPVTRNRGPEEASVQQESLGNLWATARRCLTENQFTAWWLRFGDDLSIREVAQVMRKTQVGVRVLLHRGRVRLIKQLSESDQRESTDHRDRLANPGGNP